MIVNYGLYNVLRTYCPLQMNPQAFGLDSVQVRRAFERAAAAGGDAAVLQREVERRMFERLYYIRCRPHRVLDSGCGVGRGLKLLRRRYPEADLFGMDFAPGVLSGAKREESLFERARGLVSGSRRFHLCADFARLPLLAASVMDMEVITLTYSEVPALLRDLKASGETYAARDRQRGLMGRRAWERMLASYERERKEGRLPATIEVIYGHARKGEPRTTVDGRRIIEVELEAKKSRPLVRPEPTRT